MLVLLGSPPRCTKEWARAHQVDLVMLHREDLEPAQMRKVDLDQVDLDQAEVLTPQVGLDQVLHQVQMEDSFTAQL